MIFQLNNKVYDMLKWVCLIVLPAAGTLYTAVASAWGLPYAPQIVKTIVAVEAFLGALLGVSTAQYNKGAGNGDK